MNKRDIVVGGVILVLLAGVVFWRQRIASRGEETKVPETLSVEDAIEDKFNLQIPEDVDKAELKDTSGGTASAIATRKFENNKFELSILADMPDPSTGKFYQAWLTKGERDSEEFSQVSLGRLILAKGGWMLNYSGDKDYSDHAKVIVSSEGVSDATPEQIILEGSF